MALLVGKRQLTGPDFIELSLPRHFKGVVSTSTPRYLITLSIPVFPRSTCTVRRLFGRRYIRGIFAHRKVFLLYAVPSNQYPFEDITQFLFGTQVVEMLDR